jgi:hypothetical protein
VNARSPPRLATWLLEGLGSGARLEELIGDLTEQFSTGRSRSWYWRQASGALILDLGQTLRAHAPSFLAAVLVGYGLNSLWVFANTLAFGPLYQSLHATPHPFTHDTLMRFLGLRAAQASITLLVFASAWLVTRIHRAHQRAVLVVFAAAVVAQRLPAVAQAAASVIHHSLPWSTLTSWVAPVALQAVYTPLVGLWLIRRERFADMPLGTRFAIVTTVVLTLASSLLYDLWRVGIFNYPPAERIPVDVAEVACAAYLTRLLWRRESHRVDRPTATSLQT